MKKTKMVVLIPVGPNTKKEFLLDTIESVRFYCGPTHRVILLNDTQKLLDIDIKKNDVEVIDMGKRMGKQSGLYFSLCKGMQYALENYDFEILLRMDDDALITGTKPENDAIDYFKLNPRVGMLGSYRISWDGEPRSFTPPAKEIQIETSFMWELIKLLRNIKSNDISDIVQKAKENGYELGEHVLGGVYFMSRKMVETMYTQEFLPCMAFYGSRLEEDHIFGMIAKYLGYELGDFVTGDYPMCVKWRGMPASPKEIMKLQKKVIHSTRFYQNEDERSIRQEFQEFR